MFKKLFGLGKDKASTPKKQHYQRDPLFDLGLGKLVHFDKTGIEFNQQLGLSLVTELPEHVIVEAISHSDLGMGSHLKRFYGDDDVYFQVNYTGSEEESNVDDVLFFSYRTDKTTVLSSQSEVDNWASKLKMRTFEFEGQVFERVFDSEQEFGTLAEITESVTNREGSKYQLTNTFMLFRRDIDGGSEELLLVSLEDEGNDCVTLSFAVGCSINGTSINVSMASI